MERGRGSQPIGGLIRETLDTLRNKVMTQDGSSEKPNPSATDVSATTQPTQTGTQLGEHGSAMRRNSLAIVATASETNLQHDPARLLTPSMRSSLATTWNDASDEHGWNGSVIRYELNRPRTAGEVVEAIDIAEASLLPMSKREVLSELARVRAMTVSRDISMDLQLVLAAYADELMKYPADAVREVLRGWPRDEKFWPSMSELTARLNRLVAPRHALLDGLRRGYLAPEISPAWIAPKPVTDEERAEVEAMLAEYGIITDETGRVRAIEQEPLTPQKRREVAAQARNFKLLPPDDPRVLARLREMEEPPAR